MPQEPLWRTSSLLSFSPKSLTGAETATIYLVTWRSLDTGSVGFAPVILGGRKARSHSTHATATKAEIARFSAYPSAQSLQIVRGFRSRSSKAGRYHQSALPTLRLRAANQGPWLAAMLAGSKGKGLGSRPVNSGGSEWESNPPWTLRVPINGFEVRGTHRSPLAPVRQPSPNRRTFLNAQPGPQAGDPANPANYRNILYRFGDILACYPRQDDA